MLANITFPLRGRAMFGGLRKFIMSKGSTFELDQCLKVFEQLPNLVKLDIANYVLNFAKEADELSQKTKRLDVLSANLVGFAGELRETRVTSGARTRSDPDWLKFSLCESYAVAFSPRMDLAFKSKAKRDIIDAMQRAFHSSGSIKSRTITRILPEELCEFVLRQ